MEGTFDIGIGEHVFGSDRLGAPPDCREGHGWALEGERQLGYFEAVEQAGGGFHHIERALETGLGGGGGGGGGWGGWDHEMGAAVTGGRWDDRCYLPDSDGEGGVDEHGRAYVSVLSALSHELQGGAPRGGEGDGGETDVDAGPDDVVGSCDDDTWLVEARVR